MSPDLLRYLVWPDGTAQCDDEDFVEPYPWMSDDFKVVWAEDEDDARHKAGFP